MLISNNIGKIFEPNEFGHEFKKIPGIQFMCSCRRGGDCVWCGDGGMVIMVVVGYQTTHTFYDARGRMLRKAYTDRQTCEV